ncbi:allophanate hydrolase subunit 1 [Streptosporangiaceae bacterium NEAU-GS5]|nr:allophanate hydrolase subunit 1 [Streptosporangiaceae bacterium NEAU-GS5]
MSIRRAGQRGWLVETGALAVSHRLDALLRAERSQRVEEIVPGPETVLVVGSCDAAFLESLLRTALAPATTAAPGREVTIPVVYDGADLPDVAKMAEMTRDEVIRRHTASEYVVGWLGFSPGFAYLVGLDPSLRLPRLSTPRTAVPAGSVAIAGPYTAVYPSSSPGGWRLLGRTSLAVWDVAADPPSLLPPGTRVRFTAEAS